eukprot:419801-Rhodomonas_salina.2
MVSVEEEEEGGGGQKGRLTGECSDVRTPQELAKKRPTNGEMVLCMFYYGVALYYEHVPHLIQGKIVRESRPPNTNCTTTRARGTPPRLLCYCNTYFNLYRDTTGHKET